MKRNIFLLLTGILLLSCASTKTKVAEKSETYQTTSESVRYDFADKLTTAQLDFIKKNYHWKEEDFLIINYKQPRSSCHFDNNTLTNSGKKWWKDFYSKVNLTNCLNIYVLSNGERIEKKLDNRMYFDDKYDFLLKNFFVRKETCFGIMVVNKDGVYMQFNGHYSPDQVNGFIKRLKGVKD